MKSIFNQNIFFQAEANSSGPDNISEVISSGLQQKKGEKEKKGFKGAVSIVPGLENIEQVGEILDLSNLNAGLNELTPVGPGTQLTPQSGIGLPESVIGQKITFKTGATHEEIHGTNASQENNNQGMISSDDHGGYNDAGQHPENNGTGSALDGLPDMSGVGPASSGCSTSGPSHVAEFDAPAPSSHVERFNSRKSDSSHSIE